MEENYLTFSRTKEIKAKVIEDGYNCEILFKDEFHNFVLEVTTDADLKIIDTKLHLNKGPYETCDGMHKLVQNVKGVKIEKGYNKTIAEIVGGKEGCTHLIDLFAEIGRGLIQIRLKHLLDSEKYEVWHNMLKNSCMSHK